MTWNSWLRSLYLLVAIASPSGIAWCHCELYYVGKTPTACDFVRNLGSRTDLEVVVFVGTLLGDIPATGPGEAVTASVEEIVTGLPAGTRKVTLDIWPSLMGRATPYAAGTRMVILGNRKNPFDGRVSFHLCSPHFGPGNKSLFDAVKAAVSGKPPALIGKVTTYCGRVPCGAKPGPETLLTASNGSVTRSTTIGPTGDFEFRDLAPGTWTLHAGGGQFTMAPNRPEGVAVEITSGCEITYLALWPNGILEGTVRDDAGIPAAGIPVQLDLSEVTSVRGSKVGVLSRDYKFIETTTDARGRYRFQGLPPGEYLVGINISSEAEEQAWRPLYFPNTPRRIYATPLKIGMAETLSGIDLTLPPVRPYAQLVVEAVFADGTPVPGFVGIVTDRVGRRRAGLGLTNHPGQRPNPQAFGVFLGGTYRVECDYYLRKNPDLPNGPIETYSGEVTGILMQQDDHRVRVVLRKKP